MTVSRLVSEPNSPPDKKLLRSYGLASHFFLGLTASVVGFPILLPSVLVGISFFSRSHHLILQTLWGLFLVSKEAKSASPAQHAELPWLGFTFASRLVVCLTLTAHSSRLL